jgi:hypothetical protein
MVTFGTIKKKCPKCHKNDQVIHITYGEPTSEMMERANNGEVYIGGCLIYADNPNWYCKRDDLEF